MTAETSVVWGTSPMVLLRVVDRGSFRDQVYYGADVTSGQQLRVYEFDNNQGDKWLAAIAGTFDTRWPHVPLCAHGATIQAAADALYEKAVRDHTLLTLLLRPEGVR